MPRRRKSWLPAPTPGYTTVDQVAAIVACLCIAVLCAGVIWWMSLQ